MTIAFNQLQELNSLIDRFATDCDAAQAIPSVRMYRTTAPQPPVPMAYSPGFAIVGQGAKNLVVGNERYRYGSGDYLLTAMDVPVITQIVEASERVPYYCMTLSFDTLRIVDLLHRLPNPPSDHGTVQRGVAVNPLTPELLDGAVRLLRLLDRPDQAPVLAPLIEVVGAVNGSGARPWPGCFAMDRTSRAARPVRRSAFRTRAGWRASDDVA